MIKNRLRANCLHSGFVVYNDTLIICKQEGIARIPTYLIPVDFSYKEKYLVNYITADIVSKFETFAKNKLDTLYLTEIIRKMDSSDR